MAIPPVLFADRFLTAYDTVIILHPGRKQVISAQEGTYAGIHA